MKTINRIHYFLFATLLLGMFASFAQNDYSSILLSYPYLFIGLLFFIGLFYLNNDSPEEVFPRFAYVESIALGLFFCGLFFMSMHWAIAVPVVVTGGLLLLASYLLFGIKIFAARQHESVNVSRILVFLALCNCLAVIAYTFNLQNWTLAHVFIVISGIVSFCFFLLIVFNVGLKYGNEPIRLRKFLRMIKLRIVLSYAFFSFWTIYFTMVSFGMAPTLYSQTNPTALEKMYLEQNPLADMYRKNYQHFLDNRKKPANLQDQLNSNDKPGKKENSMK